LPKISIDALVDGGKASSGPPIGPALGPTGVQLAKVISEINTKTAEFKGIKVPVTIIVDTETKTFEIKVKTPMCSQLLLREAGAEKGSGKPNLEKVANLTLEQVCKIARVKRNDVTAISFENTVRTVLGTANSAGITVDGKSAKEISDQIKSGEVKVKE